jgi:hypothetical protein
MATYNGFNQFTKLLLEGVFNFTTAAHTFKAYLTNTAPVATNTTYNTPADLSTANGYTAGGNALATSTATVSGTTNKASVTADVTITATGAVGPFRYVVAYDDTPTSPADPLISWWDYGSSISLANTETFTEDYDQTNGWLQIG